MSSPNSGAPKEQMNEGEPQASTLVTEIPYESLDFIRHLGTGNFGEIWHGQWQLTDVAIKKIPGAHSFGESVISELRREAALHERIRHPNIIALYGAVTNDPRCACLVLEFAPFGSLYDILHGDNSKQLSQEDQLTIAGDVAAGIAHLHASNIYHRDLKSPNIVQGADGRFKVCDFGLARAKQKSIMVSTRGRGAVGTPAWMAPELLDDEVDPKFYRYDKIDVYALGMVLYEIATQSVPFSDLGPSQITMAVVIRQKRPIIADEKKDLANPCLISLMEECWLQDPDMRPAVDREMLEKLDRRRLQSVTSENSTCGSAPSTTGSEVAQPPPFNPAYNSKIATKPSAPPMTSAPQNTRPPAAASFSATTGPFKTETNNAEKEDEYSGKVKEILAILAELRAEITKRDIEKTKSMFLYFKTKMIAHDSPYEHELVASFLLCLEAYESSSGMPRDLQVEFFCYLKYFTLMGLSRWPHGKGDVSNQILDVEKKIRPSIRLNKIIYADERKARGEMSSFWRLKGLHELLTTEILHDLQLNLAGRKSEGKAIFENDAMLHTLEVLAGDTTATKLLLAEGAEKVMQDIKAGKKTKTESRIIVAETFDYILNGYKGLSWNETQLFVDDVIQLFVRLRGRVQHKNEWLVLCSYLDALLNAAIRFNEPSTNDSLQLRLLDFFKGELPFQAKKPSMQMRSGISKSALQEVSALVEARLVEAIMQMKHVSAHAKVQIMANDIAKEFCSTAFGKKKSTGRIADLSKETEQADGRNLTDTAALDIVWWQMVEENQQNVLFMHPNIVNEAISCNVGNTLSEAATTHISISAQKEYETIAQFSGRSHLYSSENYWYCFCKTLLSSRQAGVVEVSHTNGMRASAKPSNSFVDDNDDVFHVKSIGARDPSLKEQHIPNVDVSSKLSEHPPVVMRKVKTVSNDDFDPLVHELINDPDMAGLKIEDSANCIRSIVAVSRKVNEEVDGQNVVVILGATGCGKSTTINWLSGCTMMKDEHGNVSVGSADQISVIGHDEHTSQTIVPFVFQLDEALSLCDAPGFLESRGTEIAIANAINILSIVRHSHSVGILQIINVYELMAARCDSAKQSLQSLASLFGGKENFNNNSDKIIFGLNFVENRHVYERARNRLISLCERSGWHIEKENIIWIDPLDDRVKLVEFLKSRHRILGSECAEMFTQAPLSEKDLLLLEKLNTAMFEWCKETFNNGDIQGVLDNFVLLEEMSRISLNQGLFHQQMEKIQVFMQDSIKEYAEREVLERARQLMTQERCFAIKKSMDQLKSYVPLDACFPEPFEVGPPIETIFQETAAALAKIEAAEQVERNQEYEMKWKTIRIVLEKELDESIRRDPDAFSSIDLLSDDDLLSNFVAACQFVGKVLNLIDQIKKEETQRSDFYFSGNLCPLVGLGNHIRSNATDIIRSCLRAVRCQQQANMCVAAVEELETQNSIADTKYDLILGLSLSHDEEKEDVLLYGIECLVHIGFNKSAIAKLLNILPALNKICCMQPPWPEKYDVVIGKVRSFISKLNKQSKVALVAATISQFRIDLNSLEAALETSLSGFVCMPDSLDSHFQQTPDLAATIDSINNALEKLKVDPGKLDAVKEEWARKKKELNATMERCVSDNALAEVTTLFAELSHKCEDALLKARAIDAMEGLLSISAPHSNIAQAKIRETFTFTYIMNGSIESHMAATKDFFSRGKMIQDVYLNFGWDCEELISIEQKLKDNEIQIIRDVNDRVAKSSSSLLEALRLGLAQFAESKGKTTTESFEFIDVEEHLFKEGFLTINSKEKIKEMQVMIADAEGALHFHDCTELDHASTQLNDLVCKIVEETARFSAHMDDLQLAEKTRQDMEQLCSSLESQMESEFEVFSKKPLTLQGLSDGGLFVGQATKVLYSMNRLEADSPEAIALQAEFDKRTSELRRRAQLHLCQELAAKIDHWCVSDEVSSHVMDIKYAFDVMKSYKSPRYDQKKATFLSFCSNKQDEGNILSHIKAKNYNAIFSAYRLIELLKTRLKDHMVIELELDRTISEFLDKQYEKAKANIVCRVDNENFLDFSDLKDFMEFSRRLLKPGQIEILKEYAKETFSTFSIGQVSRRKRGTGSWVHETQKEIGVAAKTFVKFFAVATELEMTKRFMKQMNAFLARMAPDHIDMLSESIYELHSQSSLEKICSEILSRFKVFSRKNTAIENRIRGGVTYEAALSKLSSNEDINKSNLRCCYERYRDIFDKSLDMIVNDQYNDSEMVGKMRSLGKSIKPFSKRSVQTRNQIAELVARVSAHYSYHDAQDTYFTGDKDTLLQVHATQILSIFMLLGLDQSGAPVGNINEVLTGEGKSISLAMTAAVFCFMGVEAKVICYSIYLTHKDHTLFGDFFESLGIAHMIEYTTIDWLVNSVMNNSFPDLRAQMQRFVRGKKINTFRATKAKCVLLIDEVDVFFGPEFYGALYSPGQNLKTQEAYRVMEYLWKNRTHLLALRRDDAVANVRSQEAIMRDFLEAFPRFDQLFDTIIANCLKHLRWYYSNEGTTTFDCEVVDDRIGWMDLRQGAISFTRISPSISFAYFFYNEKLRADGTKYISDASVRENVGMTVICGAVLYAELPKLFEIIVGVTGTLVGFGDDHKEILGNYGLRRLSNIPSTFDRKAAVVKPTQVITGDRSDVYFDRIKAAIYDMVKAHRAILVFFETSAEMMQFQKELEKKTIKLPNYRPPELLCESVAPQKRDAIIGRAINTNRVTLCTKTYMRGTDFKCRDSELSSLGGVHVIMTFMPSTAADEVQAKGRTCRQNDPGSYQKILFAQDLVNKNLLRTSTVDGKVVPDLSEADEMELGFLETEENRWDIFLEKKRAAQEEDIAKNIIQKLHDNTPKHERTLEMSRLMSKSDEQSVSRAVELLRSFN